MVCQIVFSRLGSDGLSREDNVVLKASRPDWLSVRFTIIVRREHQRLRFLPDATYWQVRDPKAE